MSGRRFRSPQGGFTLIELVTAITLTTIVVSFAAVFVSTPVQGYADQARRVVLVDEADVALRRMSRDIQGALPNSVRVRVVGTGAALEMLATVDGVRYRAAPPPADPDAVLDFTAADAAFQSIGPFSRIAKPFVSATHYLSVYNVGVPGADAYELGNVITPPGTTIDIQASATPGEDRITVTPSFRFAFGSPAQRVFLVSGPVSYLCNPATGMLARYDGYPITTDQADVDSDAELIAAGATRGIVASRVAACTIRYAPGTAARAGLVSLVINIADGAESVSLQHQVHVTNVP